MKIRLIEVISLVSIAESFADKKLPIKTAFKISKLLKLINDNLTFYQKELNKIILEYGELNTDGTPKVTEDQTGYVIQKDKQELAEKEINELSNLEIDISDNLFFTLDELDSLVINIQDMYLFSNFIKEDEKK